MFRDVVFEEIYGKLIKRIQNEAYLQGSKDGIDATFTVIDEMVAKGIPVTKRSIIDFSLKSAIEETKKIVKDFENTEVLSTTIEKLLSGDFDFLKPPKVEPPSDDTAVTEECTEENSTPSNVVNLFPKK